MELNVGQVGGLTSRWSDFGWFYHRGYRLEEARTGLIRSKVFYVIGFGSIFGFFWLVPSWKQGQKLRKLVVISQILIILDQLLERLGVRVPLSYCPAMVHLYIQSHRAGYGE